MGHPTVPTEPGEDCLCCWPEGQTPLAVYISFVGISPCLPLIPPPPAPINDSVEVIQDEGDPCIWLSHVDFWLFEWRACFGDESWCYQTWALNDMFKGGRDENCAAYFENVLNCGDALVSGEGGTAAVVFNMGHLDHSIGSLLHAINMEPEAKTKFDFWPASEERLCVRFARKRDATNILILVEPENL